MRALRLYSPVYVLVVWTFLAVFGVAAPVPLAVLLVAAVVLHVREVYAEHVERAHRRCR